VERVGARLVEVAEMLAAEAVVARVADALLDLGLVLGPPHARRVDVEAARLRVLEEGDRDRR
jgi:hypothetical protein